MPDEGSHISYGDGGQGESPLATEGKTEGGAKTIESTTEQFYVQRSGATFRASESSVELVPSLPSRRNVYGA